MQVNLLKIAIALESSSCFFIFINYLSTERIFKMELQNKIFIHHGSSFLSKAAKYHNNPLTDEMINEVINSPYMQSYFNKQFNGLWSCIFTPDKKYNSAWSKFVHNTKVRNTKSLNSFFTFKLKGNSKVLIINSFEDLLKLDAKYIFTKINTRKEELSKQLMNTTPSYPEYFNLLSEHFRCKHIILLNPYTISEDFDALFVTESAIFNLKESFDTWGVEALLVFNLDVVEILDSNL